MNKPLPAAAAPVESKATQPGPPGDTTSKLGAKNKRFKAALNPSYLLEVLERLEL